MVANLVMCGKQGVNCVNTTTVHHSARQRLYPARETTSNKWTNNAQLYSNQECGKVYLCKRTATLNILPNETGLWVQEKGGLLFVWPVSGPEAFIHSAAKQPAWSPTAEAYSPGQHLTHL